MSLLRRFLQVIYVLLLVVIAGVIGYMVIEGWSFVDALYMTVITISTVGYSEVHGLSTAGRIFSIILIIGGVGVMFYTLTTIVQYLAEGYISNLLGRSRMKGKLSKLKGHVILCGYGRVGQEVAHALEAEGTPFIIVELDQEGLAKAANDGYLYLQGDATQDEVLSEAGIDKARALVAAVGGDADNIYITLSARGMNPNLVIVARANTEESESKLRRAGADRIVFPLRVGGRRMAKSALHPLVVDFIDTTMHIHGRELFLEDLKVDSTSPLAGMTIAEGQRHSSGTAILAVRKKGGAILTNPPQETILELGDELVIIGTREQLRVIEEST
jgi:voltage-gated potassium channel